MAAIVALWRGTVGSEGVGEAWQQTAEGSMSAPCVGATWPLPSVGQATPVSLGLVLRTGSCLGKEILLASRL
jgi:hypothetical protein